MIGRLVIFAGFIVLLAVLAPKVAPSLIAGITEEPESGTVADVAETTPPPLDNPTPRKREIYRQVALGADSRGHFVATARINGQKVVVLVDTGASSVALNAETARRLGLYLTTSAFTERVRTANGVIAVAPVKLKEVSLGDVTVRNVEAAVSPDNTLGMNLLGMSFLGRLSKFEVRAGELILTQ